MPSGYKKPGILRASFDYQDLSAISILIDFYRQPDIYEWIELDSDDPRFASIDDIVAFRADGRFEITQVKFTVDPDDAANQLDWDWLLTSKGRGRSLLQKWSATVGHHVAAGRLEFAELFTDRRPSGEFATALVGEYIDIAKIDAATVDRIAAQLDATTTIASFFTHFRFRHSQPHLDDLEYDLQSRLVPSDTDYSGWIALGRSVKEWATLKRRPEPDGRVRHGHVRALLSRERPRPLPQNFEVPPGYQPPDAEFDQSFVDHIRGTDGTTVLWGSPGRGKSTYLSSCFQKLTGAKQICIRHHYFLHLADRGAARFFFQDIERSLIRQLEEHLPTLVAREQSLDAWLDAAAEHAGKEGCRIVVMIDGLDHVWREGRSLEHMQQLFAHLLPIRANMHLVVGTQKIAPKYLPRRLLQHCPEDSWRQLPLLSKGAINHWLGVQHAAGRLTLVEGLTPRAAVAGLAEAFHAVTAGLPLLLIYAFETLTRPGGPLAEDAVRSLPANPTGDIRDYYRSLWFRISASARSILHVLASIEFAMPPGGIHQCFQSVSHVAEAIEEIDHLLDHRETGAYPFHGSIFVFVREQADHEAVAKALRPSVLAWLDGPAPVYWKWAWTWITLARFGDVVPLIDGPDRTWTLKALCDSQPPDQVEYILQEAEMLAFQGLDFARAIELRTLWIRISNAPEFQTTQFAGFVEATLRHSDNDFRAIQLRNSLSAEQPDVLLALLRSLDAKAATITADAILREFNRRAQDSVLDDQDRVDWPATLVRVVPYLSAFEPARLKRYAGRQRRADVLISAAIKEAILARRNAIALEFASLHRGPECNKSLFALLCLEGADPRIIPAFRGHAGEPLFHALYSVRGWPLPTRRQLSINAAEFMPQARRIEDRESTGSDLRRFFFRVLSAALGGRAARVRLHGLDAAVNSWIRDVFEAVAAAALRIASELDAGQPAPSLAVFYASLAIPANPSVGYDAHSMFIAVRLGILEIAFDLQLLRRASDPTTFIEPVDLPDQLHPFWLDDLWLEYVANRRFPIHSQAAAGVLLDRLAERLSVEISEFMDRSDQCIQASLFALDHGLSHHADQLLMRAAKCLLGYGWRKDPAAFELLEALGLIATSEPDWVAEQLLRLAPAYSAITDYTDGDETNHAKAQYYGHVFDMLPDRAGNLYGSLIRSDDWSYAEDFLAHVTTALDPADARDHALLSTFIQPSELDAVRTLANGSNEVGKALVADLHRRIGYSRPQAAKDRGSSTSFSDKVPRSAPRPVDYPPNQLADYRCAVRNAKGYGWKDRAIERWLRYWRRQGRALEALAALRQLIAVDHSSFEIDRAYDLAFATSLDSEGRDAAFSWLVLAQRHRYGWQRWYTSSAEAERRLALAAKHYRDRWTQFVIESSESVTFQSSERKTIVIGQSRLISFLLMVGERDRAKQLTATLVDLMVAEVEEQPLVVPEWAR
jgi:hypothetical protein